MNATHGEGADCTMDCTGVEEARVNTIKTAKSWGRVCLVGIGGPAAFDMHQVMHKQLAVYGSWTFSTHVLREVAEFVVARNLPLRITITHTLPLSRAAEAYRLFDTRTTGKIVLVPN